MPDSDTIQTLFTTTSDTIHARRDTIHARRDTIHYTTQKCTEMEIGTELNTTLTSQWTYTNSTTLELHTHTKTQNTNTVKIFLWTKRLVPGNGAKFDRGRTPLN